MNSSWVSCRALALLMLVSLAACRPLDFDDDDEDDHEDPHTVTEHKKDEMGRVQVKVYRGPTKHDGYAPWGFWVKQPSDDY